VLKHAIANIVVKKAILEEPGAMGPILAELEHGWLVIASEYYEIFKVDQTEIIKSKKPLKRE